MQDRLYAGLVCVGLVAALGASAGCDGCSKKNAATGDISALRDALASGDGAKVAQAVEHAPACAVEADAGGRAGTECLSRVATWLGSKKGFQFDPPDQAGAATASVLIAREHRGEAVPAPEAWLFTMREGDGPGADALRLAVSAQMAREVKSLSRALDSDVDARALMRAVAASMPGACPTYALMGAGADEATLPPEQGPDHSPCVQKDLERASGPQEHGKYGSGVWRGAEGARALWNDAAIALRDGVKRPDGDAASAKAVNAALADIDAGLAKLVTKKLPPRPDWSAFMGEAHEDAGAPMAPAPRGKAPAPEGTEAAP